MLAKNKKIKKKGSYKDIIFPILIGAFIFVITVFLIISNFNISRKRGEMTVRIDELNREIKILEERNEKLKAGLIDTETDIYWEERLREQGFALPGEEAIVILPPESGEAASTGEQEKNIFEKIWEKIGF